MRSECGMLKSLGGTKLPGIKFIISHEMIHLVRVTWRETYSQRQACLHSHSHDLLEPLSLRASCSHHLLAALHASVAQIKER